MSLGLKGFSLGWGWASIRHPNTWNKGKQNTQSYLLEQDEKQRQLWHTGFTRWCKLVNVKIFWLRLLSPILQGRWSASLKQYPVYTRSSQQKMRELEHTPIYCGCMCRETQPSYLADTKPLISESQSTQSTAGKSVASCHCITPVAISCFRWMKLGELESF